MSSEQRSNDKADGAERRALGWAALAAIAAIVWLARSVGMGIFMGMLMGFVFQPVYRRTLTRLPPTAAALVTVAASMIAVMATLGGLAWLLVHDGTVLGREVLASLGPGGPARAIVAPLGTITSQVGITGEELAARARALAETAVTQGAVLAENLAAIAADALLASFFAVVTMYSLLNHDDEIRATAERALPLRREHTRKLFGELREVGRQTLVGSVGSGLMQGVLATLGYWVAGLPRPAFFGAASAIASLVPGVGTMLVWAPAATILMVLGHVGRGIFLLVWGLLVITSLNDYVIRPRLVGQKEGLPPLAMFVGLFGGAASMGLKGLIVGPVLMSLAFAVLKLYVEERPPQSPASD